MLWKRNIETKLIPLVLTVTLYLFLYSIALLWWFPRYLLPTYPLLFILGAWALSIILKEYKHLQFFIIVVIILLFINQWNKGTILDVNNPELDGNLEYIDLVNVQHMAASYIEKNYPNNTILTSWFTLSLNLKNPELGYVTKPIKVDLAVDSLGLIDDTTGKFINFSCNKYDIIYYSPQSSFHRDLFIALNNTCNMTLLKRFELNGKYAEVYKMQ
jgi:hypothetical protein